MADGTQTSFDEQYAIVLMPYGDDWHVYAPFSKDAAEIALERVVSIESIEEAFSIPIQTPEELDESVTIFEREAAEYEAKHG